MTLNQIIVLTQLYIFPDYHRSQKQQWEFNAISDLLKNDFIVKNDLSKEYDITDKGKCFIEHLNNLPHPVRSWKIP
jgi:hypothetical protein